MAVEPFSMVDYPGHIVATVFFGGCNFHCGYCHNPALVEVKEKPQISIPYVIDFLKTRKGLLDGVCLTGGEPLLSNDMQALAQEVKRLEFKVKLDTNGSILEKLQEVAPCLDYIAMDIKATPEKYDSLTGGRDSWQKVARTMDWIKQSGILYEFRTTVMPRWHTLEDLQTIRTLVGKETNWILQQFHQPPEGVLDGAMYEIYSDAWLKERGQELNCLVRGLHS